MEKICLDTEAVIDFLRGEKTVVEKLAYYANREEMCVTTLTSFQLSAAIKKPDVVRAFLNNVTILPLDAKAALLASRLLGEMGNPKKLNVESLLIASICISTNSFLFTTNRQKYEEFHKQLKIV